MRPWQFVIDDTGSVEGIYAFIYCTKWRSGRVSRMPDWLTTLKDKATQLLIKFKTGALVTQWILHIEERESNEIWCHLSRCNNVIPSENYLPAILSMWVSALILNAGFVVFEWKNHIHLMDARLSEIKPSSHLKLVIQTEAVWKVTFTFYCKHSLIEIDWPESRSECAHIRQI